MDALPSIRRASSRLNRIVSEAFGLSKDNRIVCVSDVISTTEYPSARRSLSKIRVSPFDDMLVTA